MILGILRETKKGENRVICTPKEVETITSAGHTVYAQRGCGERVGFSDEAYEAAGALLTDSVQELFKICDMVAKVKEFTPEEWPLVRTGQLLLGSGEAGGTVRAGIAADHPRRKGEICRRLCGGAGHPCADSRKRKSRQRRSAGLTGARRQLYGHGQKYAQAPCALSTV